MVHLTEMYGLFIDTASQKQTIALYDIKGVAVADASWKGSRDETEKLIPRIDILLKKAGVSHKKIGEIITVVGPGPFSSIRIGVTSANVFAYVLESKLLSITMQKYWWIRRPHDLPKETRLVMLLHAGTYSVSCSIEGKEELMSWEELFELEDIPTLFFGDITDEEEAKLKKKIKPKWRWMVESKLKTWQDVIKEIRKGSKKTDSLKGAHPEYYRPPHISTPKPTQHVS